MATAYISQVKLPGDTQIYDLKDSWAREKIGKLSNATHFLGVTSTALSDGATTNPITIGTEEVTAENGDIVVVSTGDSDNGTEYIFDGTAWYKFGDASLNNLGALAYKNGATTNSKYTGAAGTYPVVLSTTAVTGATSFKAVNTVGNYDKITKATYDKTTGVTYSKATKVEYTKPTGSGSVAVNTSATFSGTIENAVTGITGGTETKNTAASLALYSVTGGQKIITNVAINTSGTGLVEGVTVSSVTGGAATVGSATVYGLAASTTKYMTGSETLSAKLATPVATITSGTSNFLTAAPSVINECLTFYSAAAINSLTSTTVSVLSSTTTITAGTSATATTYTVGKSGATTFTQPTVTLSVDTAGLTITSGTYKVSVPANTYVTGVTAATATTGNIDVTVTGAAVTTSAVTVGTTTSEATITNTATSATIASSATDATLSHTATAVPVTTSTFYGKTTVASASHSHTVSFT